jgi:hypothetical protein
MEKYGNHPPDFSYKWLMMNLTQLITLLGKDSKNKKYIGSFEIGDAAFFELSCFLYYQLDLWLYQNSQYPRDVFFKEYVKEIETIYNPAFGINNAAKFFGDRIDGYAAVARDTSDYAKMVFNLKNIILLSTEEKPPIIYNFNKHRLPYSDMMVSYYLESKIANWLDACMPSISEIIEHFSENNHKPS